MAVCLDYQSVYCKEDKIVISVRTQLIAVTIILVALIARVWMRIEATDIGYKLAKERQRQIALDMQRRELELHRSVLLRNDNLSIRAKNMLGLGELSPQQARKVSLDSNWSKIN